MDFQLTEEQTYFRRIVRDFAESELKPRAYHTDEAAEFKRKFGARFDAADSSLIEFS